MAVRTTRLVDGVLSTTTSTFYECPAGMTAIIKQIAYNNPTGGASTTVVVSIVTPTSSKAIVRDTAVAVGTVARYGGLFIVLLPGDEITASVGTASSVGLTISGSELDGVAP